MVKKVNNIKTTDTSNLVKKSDYDTKIGEIEKKILDHNHDKYIATQEFNKMMTDNFAARVKQANLASKKDISDFILKNRFDDKLINLTKKGTTNKTKHVLVQNEFFKLPEKFKILSTTRLTKSLIKNYSFQMDYKYLIFVSMKNVSFKNSKTY